jgi:hypothetical protein
MSDNKSLKGYIVRLVHSKSAMLVDEANDFRFTTFEGGTDEMKIEEDTDTSVIEKNIKQGLLRVYDVSSDKEKDVTEAFGGKAKHQASKDKPIVNKGFKREETFHDDDVRLSKILNVNDPDKIAKYVNSINDYGALRNLIDLEKIGNNPTSACRGSILDLLEERASKVSGVSSVKKFDEEDEKVKIK